MDTILLILMGMDNAAPQAPTPLPSIVLPSDFVLYPGGWVANIVVIQPSPPPEVILPPQVTDLLNPNSVMLQP